MKIRHTLIEELRKQYSQDKHAADKSFCCDSCGKMILKNNQYMVDVVCFIKPESDMDYWCEDEGDWSNVAYPNLIFPKLCITCGKT